MSPLPEVPRGDRAGSGIAQLDALLEGGFPAARAVLVCGAAGSGKTTLAQQFVRAGLERGERAVYVTTDEKPRHLLEDAARFGWDLQGPASRAELTLMDASPLLTARRGRWTSGAVDARSVAGELVAEVRRTGARRLVIDTVTSLVPADPEAGRTYDFLRSIVHALEDNLGCTMLLTCRSLRAAAHDSCDAARHLAAGVLELRLARRGAELERRLRLVKMRGTRVAPAEFPFSIEPRLGLCLLGAPVLARPGLHTAAASG